jgi:hypothetical protein
MTLKGELYEKQRTLMGLFRPRKGERDEEGFGEGKVRGLYDDRKTYTEKKSNKIEENRKTPKQKEIKCGKEG